MGFLYLLLVSVSTNAAIDPAHAANITVYHVNPKHLGAKPINMDTGDSTGDLFFDMFEVIIYPLACPHGPHHGGSGGIACDNPEANSPDLVVNKVILEVDDRFSTYAMCNIGQNGTDGHRNKCTDGTYCCFCDAPTHPYGPPIPCNLTVGRENVYDHFAHKFKQCSGPDATVAECYRSNVVQKLDAAHPGYWYSPLEKGYCGDGDGAGAGDGDGSVPHSIGSDCTWRVVSVEKVVSRECHSKTFGDAVQASAPPACLAACGDQKTNISSPCWVDCFYQAALGPGAAKPNGTIAGMPIASMIQAWETPFLPVAAGGCPPLEYN